MTERERLEIELAGIEDLIMTFSRSLVAQIEKYQKIKGQLNRARRLEREELQNAERKS